jgi:uncharacterized protein YjbJ (UPF0337 family)
MNSIELKLQGNWNQVKGKIKEKFSTLTDDDLQYKEGQADQLLGRIQKKTGQSKDAIKEFIDKI